MPESSDARLAYLREEAMALFYANQDARRAAATTLYGAYGWLGLAAALAVALHRSEPLVTVAVVCPLLLSYTCQLYSEVSVLGAARRRLERELQAALGFDAPTYELAVAPIRQRPPLVGGVRLLQSVAALLVGGGVVAGVVAALQRPPALAAGTVVLCMVTLFSAGVSYRDMLRSGVVAAQALD
jgi:hypothetical protein